MVQMTGELVAGDSFQRLLECDEFGLVVERGDDGCRIETLGESAHLLETPAPILADNGMQPVPLGAGAIEEQQGPVGGLVCEADMRNAREKATCIVRELVQAGTPRAAGRFDAEILGTDLGVLIDTKLSQPLHQWSNRRTVDRKIAGKRIDSLRQRVQEKTRPEHRTGKQQPLVVAPDVLERQGIEEVGQFARTGASRSDVGAFGKRTKQIWIPDGSIRARQPVRAGEPAGTQHRFERFTLRRWSRFMDQRICGDLRRSRLVVLRRRPLGQCFVVFVVPDCRRGRSRWFRWLAAGFLRMRR